MICLPEEVGYSGEDTTVEGDNSHVVHVRCKVEGGNHVHHSETDPEIDGLHVHTNNLSSYY